MNQNALNSNNSHGSARIMVPEICQRLALGPRTVYGLLEARIIPSIRVGKRWVIARYAYEKWGKKLWNENNARCS